MKKEYQRQQKYNFIKLIYSKIFQKKYKHATKNIIQNTAG